MDMNNDYQWPSMFTDYERDMYTFYFLEQISELNASMPMPQPPHDPNVDRLRNDPEYAKQYFADLTPEQMTPQQREDFYNWLQEREKTHAPSPTPYTQRYNDYLQNRPRMQSSPMAFTILMTVMFLIVVIAVILASL
ncbi:MAG: hypothetical protein IKH90_11675 [Ruminococcus sp.]|nr:hypothetical protein [Ruminococcus sp.]